MSLKRIVCIYNRAPGIKITYCIDCIPPLSAMEELNFTRFSPRKPGRIATVMTAILCLVAALSGLAIAQTPTAGYSQTAPDTGSSGATEISLPSGQSPYSGSVPQGKISSETISLTFQDAIDLALKNNLGVLLQSYNTISARG